MRVDLLPSTFRAVLAGGLFGFVALTCAPSPRNVPCSNLGDCRKIDERFGFCGQGKCVECVGRGSCDGHDCVEGVCSIPCGEGGRCDEGRVCDGGKCVFADWT
jgi:hypothetical protein